METIKQKNRLLLSHKLRMSIDSAIASAAGALILLSIFFDIRQVWWTISIMIVVAIAGWWITQRIQQAKKS